MFARPAVWLTVSSSLSLVACASDSAADEKEFARTVCDELRDFNDELVDIVNGSVAGIASLPADERGPAIAAGLEHADKALTGWGDRISTMELPELDEAEIVRVQLASGATLGNDELDDQRTAMADRPDRIDDRDVQGAVGEWFNSIEKVMSVVEPEIFKLERREVKQAFLDEPACRNVIQQFRND